LTIIPIAILIDLMWVLASGHHFMDADSARTTMESLHPFKSGTIFFASITGLLLWMSSLGAGWLENWVTYRRLPDALRHNRMGANLFGKKRMEQLADFVVKHSADIGGNITLGLLLGVTPVIGVMFGVPLEVRHITLSTGSLAFAGSSLGIGSVTLGACI